MEYQNLGSERFCPVCGVATAEHFCPAHRVATFVLRRGGDTVALSAGDLVAGKFRVTRRLGQGAFGAVYEADHAAGLGKVALKVLTLADQTIEDVRRFYREAQVTAQLRHANTVRVFDVGQVESGALYIAMERLNGRALEDVLRDTTAKGRVLTQADATAIAIDVLGSLSEAHSKGLVHRDLKPANLMMTDVDGERVTKVLDFGIAWVQDSSLTDAGRVLGTPAYMSPEQCSSQPLDARSDLYALGVILFRCVAGRTPFVDANPLTVMYSHASHVPPDLASVARTEVSQAFVACVMRALAKLPDHRFASAKEMRLALEQAGKAPGFAVAAKQAARPAVNADPAMATPSVAGTGHQPSSSQLVVLTPSSGEPVGATEATADASALAIADLETLDAVPRIPAEASAPTADAAAVVPDNPELSEPARVTGTAVQAASAAGAHVAAEPTTPAWAKFAGLAATVAVGIGLAVWGAFGSREQGLPDTNLAAGAAKGAPLGSTPAVSATSLVAPDAPDVGSSASPGAVAGAGRGQLAPAAAAQASAGAVAPGVAPGAASIALAGQHSAGDAVASEQQVPTPTVAGKARGTTAGATGMRTKVDAGARQPTEGLRARVLPED